MAVPDAARDAQTFAGRGTEMPPWGVFVLRRLLSSILLLAPSPPLIFMGEEWACHQPFLFFCDFDGDLGEAVRNGRREEFARFAAFADAKARARIPDPLSEQSFKRCVLRWKDRDAGWLAHYKELLSLREKEIFPLELGPGRYRMLGERAFEVSWDALKLVANCGDAAVAVQDIPSQPPLWSNGSPGHPWTANWWK